jgi:hypothetical protein
MAPHAAAQPVDARSGMQCVGYSIPQTYPRIIPDVVRFLPRSHRQSPEGAGLPSSNATSPHQQIMDFMVVLLPEAQTRHASPQQASDHFSLATA